jgi:ankyrin repeat protein
LTPLHLAVLAGNSKIVKKLLIKGADTKIKDQTLSTPADLARKNEYINILSMLVL